MKKLLSVILSFVMIIACVPPVVLATDTENTGSLYEYEINGGEVTITKYIGSETDIDIPSEVEGLPVTAIGEKAFYECTLLKSVSVPDSVKSIGRYAFGLCVKLEQITLPNSIEVISCAAFTYCRALKSINIPEKTKTIEGSSFSNCENLESITIPASVKSIGSGAFQGSKISKLYINDLEAWLSVDLEAFMSNPMYVSDTVYINGELAETIVIPDGFTEIKPYVFCGCKTIENVTIPGSVESIGYRAFVHCDSLKNVIISEGVKSISRDAFDSALCCNYVLPSSIENLGYGAFNNVVFRILYMGSSDQWAEVNIEEDPYANELDTPYWVLMDYYLERGLSGITEDGFVYSISDTSEVTIRSVLNSSDNIIIPETIEGLPVVAIGDRAFMNVTATNLFIHSGIKDLSRYSFSEYQYGYGPNYPYRADFKNIYYEGSPGMLNSLGAGNLSNSYNVICDYEPIVGFALADGKSEITLSIGDTFEPVYEVYPENAKGVFNYSFDSDYISIKNGVITAVNPGETTVTVTTESGVMYTFTVKVEGTVGIAVLNPPSKIYYGLREPLNVEGLKIIKQYNDGTYSELTDYKLSSLNPLQRGLQIITVTGAGFTTSFNVFVSGALKGDTDLDGIISSMDSNRIKRTIVGEIKVEEYTDEYFTSDLNGDGEINALDSALLKMKLVGQ